MARQLWLLRHAEAEPHGSREDSERRLTDRGEEDARLAGLALARMGVEFDAILFSPKVRARRTAEIAAEALSDEQRALLRVHMPLAGGFGAREALDAMGEAVGTGRLLLVGHEPDLSLIAGELTGGRIEIKKGGLVVLRLNGAHLPTGAELAILLRPREIALLAGVPVGRY
ncbi:MAG TPA: histidine phosphatase family protein [Solirubrobacteraceae bacterium]